MAGVQEVLPNQEEVFLHSNSTKSSLIYSFVFAYTIQVLYYFNFTFEIVDIKSTENSKTKSNKKIVQNKQKKTKEEIREAARIKKQKQRQALREKYGDEEYKKMKAKELAEYRAKKKASSS